MSASLEVKLLGKDYRVTCEPEERSQLLAAAALLDAKLHEAGDRMPTGARGSGERMAVMVALNLAHELLAMQSTPEHLAATLESESIQRRIDFIEAKLDESLAQHEQLF
ncbi:cell division protein ZapA [Sulfuritalea sp.]|uniref:cell division protein ZapA n=1 Tax=Sulfuritalea sp. TaxID=2480090 RepID=UPI00286EADEE|nr:cell division protein ZapA [Sulfuritalea sp.]